MKNNSDTNSNVIDFNRFKEKKVVTDHYARGRTPLYMSHLDGKIKGSPHLNRPQAEDFGDRMQRIKTSLEKINFLMDELKKNSKKDTCKSIEK